jgi:hypothetical protein
MREIARAIDRRDAVTRREAWVRLLRRAIEQPLPNFSQHSRQIEATKTA